MDWLTWNSVLVFLIATASSWYGSQVGGGGLMFFSYLLWAGVPPQIAIGTHRAVVFFGKITSSARYVLSKQVEWRLVPILFLLYAIGAYFGSRVFLQLSETTTYIVVIITLIVPLFAMALKKKLGEGDSNTSLGKKIVGGFGLFGIAFWSAIMSAGTGIVNLIILAWFWGMTFVQGKATSNVASIPTGAYLSWFVWHHGFVDMEKIVPAIMGYIIGSWFGASFAIKRGNDWMRILIYIVTIASLINVIFFS